MAIEDWSEAKAWMRATRERIGMTQHDAAVLANLTVDMVVFRQVGVSCLVMYFFRV